MTATATAPNQANGQHASPPPSFDPNAWLDSTLAKLDRVRGGIGLNKDGVEFTDFAGVQRYARMLVEADLVPAYKDDTYEKKLARTTTQILLGRRVGMPPEEAVQSTFVVNNRLQIFGDAPLAICRNHPAWSEAGYEEYFEVDGQAIEGNPEPTDFKKPSTRCVVKTLRKGATKPKVHSFSVADAQQAGLMGKNGSLYGTYPHRMLRFRARGYALRDNFGDAIKGLYIRELYEPEEEVTPSQEAPPVVRGTREQMLAGLEELCAATGSTALEIIRQHAPPGFFVTDEAKPQDLSDEVLAAIVEAAMRNR